jgi:hypothetical protein
MMPAQIACRIARPTRRAAYARGFARHRPDKSDEPLLLFETALIAERAAVLARIGTAGQRALVQSIQIAWAPPSGATTLVVLCPSFFRPSTMSWGMLSSS